MKFTFLKKTLLGLLVGFGAHTLQALPLGNPADPVLYQTGFCFDCCDSSYDCGGCGSGGLNWFQSGCINFRFGYYGDFVFNRHLERTSGSRGDLDDTEIFTNAGLLVVNFWNRVDVFATLGATSVYANTQSEFLNARNEFEFSTDFSWSVGGKVVLWELGCTVLGIEGQYSSFDIPLKRTTLGTLSSYPSGVRVDSREWQVGLGLAHRFNILVPYVGVKYSDFRGDLGGAVVGGIPLSNIKSQKHWGAVVGVSLIDCGAAGVTAEGRWGDEKAFHINGQVRF